MRVSLFPVSIALSAIFPGVSTNAVPAEMLHCMELGVAADGQTAVESYVSSMKSDGQIDNATKVELFKVLGAQGRSCMQQNSWSSDKTYIAMQYRLYMLKIIGLERHSLLTPEQSKLLKSIYFGEDHSKIRNAMMPLVLAGMDERPAPPLSSEQRLTFGSVARKLGTGGNNHLVNNYVGSWLGANVAVEYLSESFSKKK